MGMVLADIAKGKTGAAELFFLVAVVLFVLYAIVGWTPRNDARIAAILLGLGLACVALALLLL